MCIRVAKNALFHVKHNDFDYFLGTDLSFVRTMSVDFDIKVLLCVAITNLPNKKSF